MSADRGVLITTERILVRRFNAADFTELMAYRTDPDVARYQDWDSDGGAEDAKRYVADDGDSEIGAKGHWYQFAIAERSTGRLCGDVGVHFVADQPDTVELGLTLSPESQGVGIGVEAARSVMSWLFETFDVHRIFAHVDERNRPARALLSRLGMRQEAVLVDANWFKGEWTTLCTYGILSEEWQRTG
jgi:RimJ/RimL family protein N-acetyltransferase